MDIDQVIKRIRSTYPDLAQYQIAQIMEISPAYLSDVINHRKDPGKAILEPLGLEKRISYVEKKA